MTVCGRRLIKVWSWMEESGGAWVAIFFKILGIFFKIVVIFFKKKVERGNYGDDDVMIMMA